MLINFFPCFLFHSIFKSKTNHLHVVKELRGSGFSLPFRIGTLAHDPLLKNGPYGLGRKEEKEERKEGKEERKKGRKAEKERKEGRERTGERKGQSTDRSSLAGGLSIFLAEAKQYLFQEGGNICHFHVYTARSFRSPSVCFIWYLILPSLVRRPDSIRQGPDSVSQAKF